RLRVLAELVPAFRDVCYPEVAHAVREADQVAVAAPDGDRAHQGGPLAAAEPVRVGGADLEGHPSILPPGGEQRPASQPVRAPFAALPPGASLSQPAAWPGSPGSGCRGPGPRSSRRWPERSRPRRPGGRSWTRPGW